MRRALAVTGCAAVTVANSASAGVLMGEELMQTHVGKCIAYTGKSVQVKCFHAAGTMDYDDESYGRDTGTWSVKDDTIWQEWSAEPGVSHVPCMEDGDGTYSEGGNT